MKHRLAVADKVFLCFHTNFHDLNINIYKIFHLSSLEFSGSAWMFIALSSLIAAAKCLIKINRREFIIIYIFSNMMQEGSARIRFDPRS